MTREELRKVIFKNHSPLTVKEVMDCVDKYVAKVRADAIEESMRAIVNTESKVFNPCADKEWDILTLLADRQFEILNILEQLKAQNNM